MQQFSETQQQHYKTTPGQIQTMSPQATNANQGLEVDFVVRNVYSKIKSLENKYIDLANFYKETSKLSTVEADNLPRNQTQTTSNANQVETSMIRELYEKKRDLEENIKNLKTAVSLQKADPSLQLGQQKNTKRVLNQSFAEVSNSVENAQAQCLKALAQKQNEMFQLATKHKLSSAFRNETLGLWYDTKTMIAQCFTEVKQAVIQVQHQSDHKLGLSYVYSKDDSSSAINQQLLTDLNDEIFKFSRKQNKQRKEFAKIQLNFTKNIADLKKQHENLMNLVDEMTGHQDDSILARRKIVDKSVYLSPFQRKLQTYSNAALGYGVLSSSKRSASKGQVSQQKIQMTNSSTNIQLKSTRALKTEDNGVRSTTSKDGRSSFSRGRMDHLKNALKVQGLANMQQQALCADLFGYVDRINEEGSTFTKLLQDQLNQQQNPNKIAESNDRLQELQQQNEQIYSELKSQNEKYIDLRVENSKLRDQMHDLQSKSQTGTTSSAVPQGGERIVADTQQHRDLLEQLCDRVSKFMQAMRQLQKAVNRKDPDVAGPKENFESQKNALQGLVVQVRELLHANEQIAGQQYWQQQQLQQYSSIPKIQVAAGSHSPLREKRPTVSSSQLNKLPLLLQNVKNLQLEKQKLQELIDELKQAHAFDIEQMQLKSKQKSERLQKFAAQCTFFQIKQQTQDQLLFEYRQLILHKDSSLADHLSHRQKQIEQKINDDVARIQPSLRLDPQVTALKEDLVSQIRTQTQLFEAMIDNLNNQLRAKEEGLNRLKSLFVDKLHELETTFVEISNEVAETEHQNMQQAQQKRAPNQFERSVETVLSKFENDDREKDFMQLAEANAELIEQNAVLKQTLQSIGEMKNGTGSEVSAQLELVIELQDQLDTQKVQLEKQIAKSKELEQSESVLKKEIQTLKYDNKRNQFDLKDAKERFEKAKNEYQAQFNGLKMTIISQKQQVDKEVELRQGAEQRKEQLMKDITSIMHQKMLTDTVCQNLTLEMTQLKEQLQSQQEAFECTQNDLNEQVNSSQQEIELLKMQNIELQSKNLQQEDSNETTEILNSHMEAFDSGTYIEIAVGDLKEYQLVKLIQQIQASWTIQRQKLIDFEDVNTEMGFQIQELQTEVKVLQIKIDKRDQMMLDMQKSDSQKTVAADKKIQTLSLQSKNLYDQKVKELQELSERLDDLRKESTIGESSTNMLQESFDSQQIELQTCRQKLEVAETNFLSSKQQNEETQLQLIQLTDLLEQTSQQSQLNQEQSRKQTLLISCLHKTVHEILKTKINELNLQKQTHSEQLEKLKETLEADNDELIAQVKHLNTKLVIERQTVQDLDQKLKQQQQSNIDKKGENNNNNELQQKMNEATKMLETFKQEYQKLKDSSQLQEKDNIEKDKKLRQELQDKYKQEMKSFLSKAVDDRKTIEANHKQESQKQKNEIELLATAVENQNAATKDFERKILELIENHLVEINQLKENEKKAVDAAEKLKAVLYELSTNKNTISAQYEEELRQAEQMYADLETKMQTELQNQAQICERQINEILLTKQAPIQIKSLLGGNDKKVKLYVALQNHFKNILNAKLNELSLICETQAIQKLNLEQNLQQAEYKQLQQEGELRKVTEEFKKYKTDANTLMMGHMKRQSELKKTDDAKSQQIASLQEYQSNIQEQIVDYAAQIQKSEQESEKLLEHVSELQSELNQKQQLLQSLQTKMQRQSPEKSKELNAPHHSILEMKIQELQSLIKENEELISQLKKDNDRLKKTPDDKRNSWEMQNNKDGTGRGSWGSNGATASQEVEEHLKHIRQIMIQFLTKLPFTTKENEDILPILFSMLNFKENEIETVTVQRQVLNKDIGKDKTKETGIFGFGKKKQQKK